MAPADRSFPGGLLILLTQHNQTGHQGAGIRFHMAHTQQSKRATHNCAEHTHNCKQLFITHSDLRLVAAVMAPDLEVKARTRLVIVEAHIPTSPDMNIQHVVISTWMFPISVCFSWVSYNISSKNELHPLQLHESSPTTDQHTHLSSCLIL